MKVMKRFALMFAFWGIAMASFAQGVTTGSITGLVVDTDGAALPGATIQAVHMPSGTSYGTATSVDGRFTIPGMRVGSPYKVTISFVGYASWEQQDISVNLGAATAINVALAEEGIDLQEVLVLGRAGSVGQNTGTSTRISSESLEALPSVNRNLNDFLRLTPQSTGYGGGISFAGVNNRYNAIYIDGAVNNDVFGLASSGTNGGQTGISPFSVDIIDQFQIVLSPYDVTLGGFAGGGINAVTKSGTNTLKGTAYTYFQNQSLVGKTPGLLAERLDAERTKVDDFAENVYGLSLGGPIIKDKLFFFTNLEIQRDETPRPFDITEYTSTAGRASVADLENLRNFLITNYDYDPGTFGSTTRNLNGLKIFGKLDYNLSDMHRLTLRHQYTKAEQFSRNSGNSRTVNFSNNGIYFPSISNSTALELNSRFGNDFSNNLIVSFIAVRDDRDPLEKDFPYVQIDDVSSGLIRLGSEEFSTANRLDQDILSITNNFNIYKGSHKFTIGTHNEFYSIYNVFVRQNFGSYRFSSINDFITGVPAYRYDRSYSLVDNTTGDDTGAASDFNAIQLGFYVQDEWTVSRKLTLTYGLRVDVPIITDDPMEDTYFNNTALPQMQAFYPIAENVKSGEAPSGQIMLSPRFGFSYDMNEDGRKVIRGGAGIFTSRIPFVWPGGMFNNNGLTVGSVREFNLTGPANFIADPYAQYVHPSLTPPLGQVDVFTQDFKYPQIFRTNLAYDFELPWGIASTFEGLYTKTLNNILYTQINTNPTVNFTWTGSPDNRSVYVNSSIDGTYSDVYLASNTSEGYTYNLTASFAKKFDIGLTALLSYNYNDAYALSEGTSSQNSSQWRGQVNVNGRNEPSFGRSDFAIGHRVITSLSYQLKWTADGNNKTTISLFVNGQSGNPFSYVIGGSNARNLNRERGSTGRNRSLVFIPETAADLNLVDYTVGTDVVTAATQWENLDKFIEEDPYLSKNRGKYAEKNGAWGPFGFLVDFSLRHDFGLKVGANTHKFQLSLDIANVGNMLNKDWGTVYSIPGDFNNFNLYEFIGYEADGTTPRFNYRSDTAGLDSYDIAGLSSRWSMLFGLRYIFN